jgi:hypothetical protein
MDKIKSLQHRKTSLDEDEEKPKLASSENGLNQIKSNGLLSKVFKIASKNKNSFEKMWSKD